MSWAHRSFQKPFRFMVVGGLNTAVILLLYAGLIAVGEAPLVFTDADLAPDLANLPPLSDRWA